MGQQVNVSCPDDLVAALDRVATARRMARPELVRAIMLEAVEAHEAGRLAFRREDGPRLDVSISGLVVQLREALTESARLQAENMRFAKRQIETFTAAEQTVQAATERVAGRIRELNRASYKPFVEKLEALCEHLEAAEERTQAAVDVELSAIHARLDKVLKAGGEARVVHNLILGDNRTLSLRFLMRLSWFVGGLFIVLFLALAQWSQPVALYIATGLINSDERVCLLVNWKGGVADCQLPKEVREKALAVIATREEEPDKPGAGAPKTSKGARK
jgi:hypothetical protein